MTKPVKEWSRPFMKRERRTPKIDPSSYKMSRQLINGKTFSSHVSPGGDLGLKFNLLANRSYEISCPIAEGFGQINLIFTLGFGVG